MLAIVRRTWNGQSPFAADRGHLHHRLLDIGHSHSRAVWIMYFWSALISFGAVAFSVNSSSLLIVLSIVVLSAMGLLALLMPRFRPRAPRWAEAFVPPRYRRTRAEAAQEAHDAAAATIAAGRPLASTGRPRSARGPWWTPAAARAAVRRPNAL